MFKVGDRVWVISEKRYGIVSDIEDTPQGLFIHIDNRHSYVTHLIHQTAQTMFEELGYEKKLEDGSFIIFEYFNFENPFITELRIDKINKCHTLSYYTKNNKIFSGRIDVKLLQAIYQLYIEKGWVE